MYASYCGWSCFFKHKFDKLAPASWCDSAQHRTIQNFSCRLSNFSPLKSAAYVVQWICRIHYQWSTIKNILNQYYIWGNFGDCSIWGDKLIKKSRKHSYSNPAHLNNCDVPLNIFYSSLIKKWSVVLSCQKIEAIDVYNVKLASIINSKLAQCCKFCINAVSITVAIWSQSDSSMKLSEEINVVKAYVRKNNAKLQRRQ